MTSGIVYSETLIHSAPEAFSADAPYQLILVTTEDKTRITGRVLGEHVFIGDRVEVAETRGHIAFFKKTSEGEVS